MSWLTFMFGATSGFVCAVALGALWAAWAIKKHTSRPINEFYVVEDDDEDDEEEIASTTVVSRVDKKEYMN